MKHTLVLNLRPAPWRSETELGEAGIMTDWEVLDENGNKIGSYVVLPGCLSVNTRKLPGLFCQEDLQSVSGQKPTEV